MIDEDDEFKDLTTFSSVSPKRLVYTTKEFKKVPIPISQLMNESNLEIYPLVKSRGYFDIYLKSDTLVFQAGGYIGLIPINDRVAIDIYPKVPIKNLEHLIRIANHIPISLSPYNRDYSSYHESNPSLLDFLTAAFVEAVKSVETYGLHREYLTQEYDTSFPKGRIEVGKTIQRYSSKGINNKITTSWFEPTYDTSPNRCLKYTIWCLAQKYKMLRVSGARELLRSLNRLYPIFNGVSLDQSKSFLNSSLVLMPELLPSAQNYYHRALYLASMIINDESLGFKKSEEQLVVASLLINMEKVFEDYLRIQLNTGFKKTFPYYQVLNGNLSGINGAKKPLFNDIYSNDARENIATPDIVISDISNGHSLVTHPIVIDVKYKEISKIPDRDDINQIITYAVSFQSSVAVLVHPKINDRKGLSAIGKVGGITVYQYIYDLDVSEMDKEETTFAKAIGSLLPDVKK